MFQTNIPFIFMTLLCSIPLQIGAQSVIQVEGAVKIGNNSDPSPALGTVRWSGSDFEVWNGILWASLTKGEGTVQDIDGNTYNSILIGEQVWMTENLKVGKYRDGSAIPSVTNPNSWRQLTSGAWCRYDNNLSFEIPYGKLYNWYAVVDSRGLCPGGWHVPADEDWDDLRNYLDPNAIDNDNIAGGPMKTLTGWFLANVGATNESGFTGLPGGNRDSLDGSFDNISYVGFWWSSSQSNSTIAFKRNLHTSHARLDRSIADKKGGYSVRCLKN